MATSPPDATSRVGCASDGRSVCVTRDYLEIREVDTSQDNRYIIYLFIYYYITLVLNASILLVRCGQFSMSLSFTQSAIKYLRRSTHMFAIVLTTALGGSLIPFMIQLMPMKDELFLTSTPIVSMSCMQSYAIYSTQALTFLPPHKISLGEKKKRQQQQQQRPGSQATHHQVQGLLQSLSLSTQQSVGSFEGPGIRGMVGSRIVGSIALVELLE